MLEIEYFCSPMVAGKTFKGYLLGVVAAISYGLNPAFTLPLYADGMNPESVLLFRYGFAILTVAVMILIFHRKFRVQKKALLHLFCLGILMAASSLFLFISYKYMAAGIASTILFVYPIFVAVLMALVFKEKITSSVILCIAVATMGIMLLYNTGNGNTLSLFGTITVILSALSYAVYLVWIGKGIVVGLSSLTVTFYVLCFGILLLASPLLLKGEPLILPSQRHLWLNTFALALFPTAVSLLCTKMAIRMIGSTPTAILGALEPVTAVIVGMLFFGEGMTVRELVDYIERRGMMQFEVLDQQKSSKKSNIVRNPNAQKINSKLAAPDLMGLVAVTNAEKVILSGKKTDTLWDGSITSDQKPLRMKIRSICGDETIFEL